MPIPPELNGKKVRAAVTVVLFEDDSVGLDLPAVALAQDVPPQMDAFMARLKQRP